MGEVRVPADALYGAQTQRAVENFPISAIRPRAGADRRARPHQEGRRARQRGARRRSTAPSPTRSSRPPTRSIAGEYARPVPDRRLPDRLGHVVEHEHERGARDARHRAPRRRRCTPTTTSTPRSRRTTCSRPRCTSPSPARSSTTSSRRSTTSPSALEAKAEAVAGVVKSGRTHLMDATPVTLGQEFGGYARQMRLGIERVAVGAPPRRRGAARRHRRRHRHQHARWASRSRSSRCSPPTPSCRSPRRGTTSRRRATATGSSRRPARCAPSRSR